jgi:hypothetical protein
MPLSTIFSTVQLQINRYICPAALIFGIAGGLLNIFLFSRNEFRTTSCCTCKSLTVFFQLVII